MNPELPGSYVNLLVDVLKRWDIAPEQLLSGTGISSDKLNAPFWYVDFNIFNYLLERAAQITDEPAISVYLAKEMKISCYGHIGVAATASEDLGSAIEVLEQYIGLHCAVFKPKLQVDEKSAYLYFNQPLQQFRFNKHAMIFLVFGFAQIVENLAQQRLDIRFEFQQDKPDFYKKIFNINQLNGDFNTRNDRLIINKNVLSLPLKTADALVARLTIQQCKQDIQKLFLKMKNVDSTAKNVKDALYDEALGFLSLKQVAERLHLSERTLQRQLTKEQTSFQLLVAEVRRKQAEFLLKQQHLSIEQIAERLGYADISHFSRAFKKWTNVTPKFYREVERHKATHMVL
ncbi:AraC family transcriptional regulator [Acinetobacter suaedae]|uniref:AraC family transcriptional regulator n=1 Tax=Acinetobacter suaedae TaxID=2609668 RepID=A0A5P1UST7_9GAMM|nr:AraC family transcriptional regulator [Acinetobacter sp. C16S1]QER39674.1 AraC family transcriptional regulator [Acinetobacter sp. C16S1]